MPSATDSPSKTRIIARKLVSPITDTMGFFRQTSEAFGPLFIVLIGLVYFLQGFRVFIFGGAFNWYYRNEFKLNPGQVQAYTSTAMITWNIKMIYGLIFDNFPLVRRHDQPYMIFAAIMSLVGFVGLGVKEMSNTPQAALAYFWLALMGMAMADVIADAMVVKRARIAGQRGGANLQTFCWTMYFVGTLTGRPTAGAVAGSKGAGARTLIMYYYTAAAGLLVLAAFFLVEKPSNIKWSLKRFFFQLIRLVKGVLFNPKVLLPISWIVIRNGIVPDVSAGTDYWKAQEINIGADIQIYLTTSGDVLNIVALMIYARFFKETPFRKMFFWTQLFSAILLFSDVILVNRWNVKVGLPDIPFLIGSDAIYAIMDRLFSMPFLVLAAQLCPAELEAAFYATMTSLSNAGGNASIRFGSFLLNAFGVVINEAEDKIIFGPPEGQGPKDDYLKKLIWLRWGLAFVPLLLIFMVPNVASINPYDGEEGEGAEGVEGGEVPEMTVAEREALEEKAAQGDKLAQDKLAQQMVKDEAFRQTGEVKVDVVAKVGA
ncbi:hypothetical protein HK102_000801, partial [Quaeritorhiza haematococci]